MEFRHLRYFLALAEELHFGRAAERLSISQPPLSLNIQQLEASIAAKLFIRNSREVRLTSAGVAFVPKARALLEQAQEAARHARDVERGLVGRLQIGFVGAMLYRGLPQMLRQFQAQYPRLRVLLRELSSQEQLIELSHERLDVGFVHTTQVPPELSRILVARQPFVCCLPASHPKAGSTVLALRELEGEPFATVARAVSPDYHERIVALCMAAGFHPDLRYELRHWLSVVSLVSQGLGVALVPEALRQSGLANTVFLPLDFPADAPSAPYDTYCLWKTKRDNAPLSSFLEAVRAAEV